MVWFRIDDSFYGHPKAVGLSNDSLATWARAGEWCAWQLTDGLFPHAMLAQFAGDARDPDSVASDLVLRRLWEPVADDDGLQFHDWADWNPTRAQVLAKRKSDRERRRRWLDKAAAARNAVSNAVTDDHGVTRADHAVSNAVTDPDHGVRHGVDHAAPDPTRPEGEGRTNTGKQSTSGRTAQAREDDDDLLDQIIALMFPIGAITREQAAAYRDHVLTGRRAADPAKYVIGAIRQDPRGAHRLAVTAAPAGRGQPPPPSLRCRRCGLTGHREDTCSKPAPADDSAKLGAAAARQLLADKLGATPITEEDHPAQPGADPAPVPDQDSDEDFEPPF